MYKVLIRPILFLFPPEFIHKVIVIKLKVFFGIPFTRALLSLFFSIKDKRLEKTVCGITFPNPVGIAAGFDKNGEIYNQLSAFGFGFIEIGTITPKPQPGNPQPRLFRLIKDQALINRMGINNDGVEAVVKRLKNNPPKCIIGANIGKNTITPIEESVKDYLICFEALYDHVAYFTVNISCPNVADVSKIQNTDNVRNICLHISNARKSKQVYKPVFIKVSPDMDIPYIDEIIGIVRTHGLDGIVATNTSTMRTGLISIQEQLDTIGKGGLSGHPLTQRATEVISHIAKNAGNIPVMGVGGIFTPQQAYEKITAGASLIQVYTGFIYEGPFIAKRICKQLINRI